MPPAAPAAMQLAQRLRQLRQQHWSDARLTQQSLAMVFSAEEKLAPATVASWENHASPKLPPRHRLLAYARFFATYRSVEGRPKLLSLQDLTEEERVAYAALEAELLKLRTAAGGQSDEEDATFNRSWLFSDIGPATLICAQLPVDQTGPLGDPANPNHSELQKYSDLDSLVELYGHIRAENPLMSVVIKSAPNVTPDDLTGHLILVGGVAWNRITDRLAELTELPVRQVSDPEVSTGEIFSAEIGGSEKRFFPKWADYDGSYGHNLIEDVGMLARVPNPLNSSRTLTFCNGIHSSGVYGAVRSLTDPRLRDSNERFISINFENPDMFAILMPVKIIENHVMTPDFNSPNGVLHRWPDASALPPALTNGPKN
jgi:hypothetical protein